MKNELWTRLFGFEINREMKQIILEEIRNTGEPIEQVIARHTLPEMAILDDSGCFDYQGQKITVAEWRKINPLGEHGRIVTITTREQRENLLTKNAI